MSTYRLFVIFIFSGFAGISLLLSNQAHAQTDDGPKVDFPASVPDEGSKIDWSQIEMPVHEQREVTDAPAEAPDQAAVVSPPPAPNFTAYTIQRGDTLYKIARKFAVDIAVLTSVNNIANPSRIFVGQILQIPGPETTVDSLQPALQTNPTDDTYIVQTGDTLHKIAVRFSLDLSTLAAINDINNPSYIRVGQVLQISTTAIPTAPSPIGNSTISDLPPINEGQTYFVQPGDSLTKIARRFGTSAQVIAAVNQITNPSLIYSGQILTIPAQVNDLLPASPSPVEPLTSSEFIWPADTRTIVKGYQVGHRAIDILLTSGSPVYATGAGKVEYAGWNDYGYGNLVVIDHGDGWRTLYAHNSAFKVNTGDAVAQGDVIASSGNTGNSTMPHIHFEMIRSNQAQNPCFYLLGGC